MTPKEKRKLLRRVTLSSWPIRQKLLLLFACVFVPALILALAEGMSDRQVIIAKAERETAMVAESLAAQQEKISGATKQLLGTLAQLPEVQRLDIKACNAIFKELSKQNPHYTNISLATPDGNMVASSLSFVPGSVNLSDRRHIKEAIRTRDFSAGEYITGRVSKVPSLNFTHPVFNRDGKLVAIVIAAYNLTDYNRFMSRIQTPEGFAVSITDYRGIRLFRWPEQAAASPGQSVPKDAIDRARTASEGIYRAKSADGLDRLYTFKAISLREGASPYLYIFAGHDETGVLHTANNRMIFQTTIIGFAALIVASLAWLLISVALVKPIRRLALAAQNLGHGERGIRTGLPHGSDEIGQLAASFDAMATMLDAREKERDNAEEALRENEKRLTSIFNAQHNGIVIIEPQSHMIIDANTAALGMIGATRNEIVGRECHHFICPAERGRCPVTDLGLGIDKSERLLIQKDGTQRSILKTVSWLQLGSGNFLIESFIDITERKQAEERLKQSEEMFRNLVGNMLDAAIIIDWEGTILFANRAAAGLVELETPELSYGRNMAEFIHPESIGKALEDLELVKQGTSGFPGEYKMITARGNHLWVSSLGSEITFKGQAADLVTLRDITERRQMEDTIRTERSQAEELFRQSEEKFTKIFMMSPNSISIARLRDGLIIDTNIGFREITGWEQDEVLGRSSLEINFWDDPADRMFLVGELEAGRDVLQREFRFRRKDGSARLGLYSARSIRITGEEFILFVMQDITERKQAEEQIRESEERFRRLANAAQEGIIIHRDGTILDANESACRMFGYELKDAVGRNVLEFLSPESVTPALKKLGYTKSAETYIEVTGLRKDKTVFPIELFGRSIMLRHERAWIVAIRDLSERKSAEQERQILQEQLQQAMKMEAVGRLAGGVAHDFNNLLTVISGYVELAKVKLKQQDPLLRPVDGIQKAAESAASLTRQLLAFSRRQIIEPKVVNLNDLISGLAKMLTRLIGEDVVLETVLDEHLESVRVDPGQFEQVVVNLSVNARDAMPVGGRLVIETSNCELDDESYSCHPEAQPGKYIVLAISDTGHGMTEDVKQRIFEPFFTTKAKGHGTGLGLATTFGIVKQAGGTIEVHSEVNRGTTFKIYLPAVEEAAALLAAEVRPPEPARGKETVLLVEDDDSVRDVALNMLEHLGYRIRSAAGGDDAVLLMEKHADDIAIVMTDVVMPGMNGRELAGRLQTIKPSVKVLFTSGYTEDVIVHHGVLDSNLNFIGKPYTMQVLAKKIRDVLGPDGK